MFDNLTKFDEESMKQIAENLCCPPGQIPDLMIGNRGGAVSGVMIPMPPFVFGVKSHARLLVATDLLKFYETVG